MMIILFNFWEEYDKIRCGLLRLIREEFKKINWENLPKEEREGKFDEIYEKLIKKFEEYINKLKIIKSQQNDLIFWDEINRKKISKQNAISRLKGALYEVLFYYSFVRVMIATRGLEILEFGGLKIGEKIKFEILPISGPIATIFYQYKTKTRFAPQIDADYLVLFVSEDEKVHPPIFIDVKSSEYSTTKDSIDRLKWQALGCRYMECIFQVAYPKKGIEYPKNSKDWEIRTVCPRCGNMSKDDIFCDKCNFRLNYIKRRQRRNIVWQLGESKDPSAIPKLIEFTKSTNANERRLAASALGKLAKYKPQIYEACPHLIKLLKDEKPQVRQYAAKALGKIGYIKAIPYLKELLNDEKYYVRDAAKEAIKKCEMKLKTIQKFK